VFTNELMTGWAGPGTNLPLSRVTIGSLADLGYTVNYAAADPYMPTAAGLAAGRSASSSLAGARSFGILAGENGVSVSPAFAGATSNLSTAGVQSRRSTLPTSHITPIDQEVADYIMAAAARNSSSATSISSDSTTQDDSSSDTCVADAAWDSLASDWNLWPAEAVA
jgi:hypothetical protein